ncbi:Membrane protein involved in the export of O-antigen and teichoic acid [Arboricoccus pini]|uniref:Membrane protein involved in the export of O-antigen and teichoic acid n=1 Tax=Arboricoccus pini TaxID=1963835 RepID=A0A212RSJ0_9PROT|nr:oligosaccharide flippase family protein [Arboricoccus pini]SNB75473.1 Membrane protein involved in the export of O-antigen and teichoic acid [Arboricoccus pini]
MTNLLDIVIQFGSAVLGRGFYVVLQIVLARVLGPHDFGIYAIGWTVVGLVSTLTPLGMPQAALRFSVGGRASLLSAPMILAGGTSLLTALGLWFGAGPIARHIFGAPDAALVIQAFAPSVFLLTLFTVMLASLRASGGLLASAIAGALIFIIYFAATVLVFQASASASAAAHMYNLALVLVIGLTVFMLAARPSQATPVALRTLIQFGLITMFINSANVLNIWADRVVLGMMSDASAVGIYQVASQLAMIPIVLRSAVITVFEARVPKVAAPGASVPEISQEFTAALRILLHMTGPGLLALALTAGFWVRLLFGEQYVAAAPALAILALGQLGATLFGPSTNALHMTGKERLVMVLTVGCCIFNLAGNVLLIPFLGSTGAALASAIAIVLVGFLGIVVLLRTGRLTLTFGAVGDMLAGLGAAALVMAAMIFLVGTPSLAYAILVAVTGYVAYALLVYCLCTSEDELVDLVRARLARLLGQASLT